MAKGRDRKVELDEVWQDTAASEMETNRAEAPARRWTAEMTATNRQFNRPEPPCSYAFGLKQSLLFGTFPACRGVDRSKHIPYKQSGLTVLGGAFCIEAATPSRRFQLTRSSRS